MAEDVVFSIDLRQGNVEPMPIVTLPEVGIRERADLQRWVGDHPEIVGDDLLLVTTEFNQWELKEKNVADRLDVLFVDSDGALVVAELKRDHAPDTTELQGLKYAAYCSQLTVSDVVEEFARYHRVDRDAARTAITDHAPSLEDGEFGPTRIRLVARTFGPSVTTVVLWLRDLKLDIGCIEITARRLPDGNAMLVSRQLLPPPAAEDYLVKRRRREAAEEQVEAPTRRRNAVTVLLEAGTIPVGEELTLNLDAMQEDWKPLIQAALDESPALGVARWTGQSLRTALKWEKDGETYSATGLVWKILTDLGVEPPGIAGPWYWRFGAGLTIAETARALEGAADDGQPERADGPASTASAQEDGTVLSDQDRTKVPTAEAHAADT